MQISTAAPPPRTANAAPNSNNKPPADDAGATSFADLLGGEQGALPDAAAVPPTNAQAADRQAAQRKERTGRAPANGNERPQAKSETSQADAAEDGKTVEAEDGEAADATADASLMHWLHGLHLGTHAQAGEAADAAGAHAGHVARGARAGKTGAETVMSDAGADTTAATQANAAATAATANMGASAQGGARDRMAAALDRAADTRDAAAITNDKDPAAAMARTEPAGATRFADTLAALRAPGAEAASSTPTANASTTATAATEAAATVAVPVPLDDPQFPRAFGVQVSVLARDGVQQAELHLNPAEMGPVSVQIALEGAQARIDFGADAAPTRALIEQSLPDLAAALREAGLTLAGGGVSQHAGGRDARDASSQADARGDGSSARASVNNATTEAAARPVRRAVRAGGVDLYA